MNGNRLITTATTAFALLLAAGLSSSCTREGLIARKGITFRAQSTGFVNPDTKTVYGGFSGSVQVLEWTDGDKICVFSPQAFVMDHPETHYSDFTVKNHTNSGAVSKATIIPSSDPNSLQWDEDAGEHSFYAMYPCPTGSPTNSFDNGNMVFSLPAAQAPLSTTVSAGTIVLAPHLAAYGPMLAATTGLDPAENPDVPLAFTPQFNAFEVVINKGAYESVNLTQFRLLGDTADCLAGTFTVNAGAYNAVASIADASNVITMDLTGVDSELDSTNPNLQLTVFTLPQNFTNGITIEFTGVFDDGIAEPKSRTAKITLKYSGGSLVPFAPYRKSRISGLSFPIIIDSIIGDPDSSDPDDLDTISWDCTLDIYDGLVWWLAPGIENHMFWSSDLDMEFPTIARSDVVKWFDGITTTAVQEIAWEELSGVQLCNVSTGDPDDSDMYLWRHQVGRRTVKALNHQNNAYSDVVASWSCTPATGVITVDANSGIVRAVAPGSAIVTATVTPQNGSDPWTVSYNVYVNAPTEITLTAAADFVRPSNTVALTATVTFTSNGTLTEYPADLLVWNSANTSAITVSGETQPAIATGQATATATGVAEGTSTLSVSIADKYGADGITASLTNFPCRETSITITSPGEPYKFRGYYLSPGVLYWNGSAYELTSGADPLELLQHYYHDGRTNGFDGTTATHTDLNVYYHAWAGTNSLYHRLHGSNSTTPDDNITATITVSGQTWKIPTGLTGGDWDKIFTTSLSSISSPNITINGTPKSDASYNYVRITVDLTNATKANGAAENYNLKGLGTNNDITNVAGNSQYQCGILLIPDGAIVSCKKISEIPGPFNAGTNCLGWDDLKTLTDGGCVFLPAAGYYTGSNWSYGGLYGRYWSATQSPTNTSYACNLVFDSSNVRATDSNYKNLYFPVRLVRVATP